jgi:hypothetical protein
MLLGPLSVVVVFTVAFAGCGGGDGTRVVLPEDPCALVRADDVAAAVHAQVSKVERVPSIDQVVAAQDEGGNADGVPVADRRLCSYTTTSGFGSVIVFVPKPSAGGADLFKSGSRPAPGQRDPIQVNGVGDDAYLTGGGLNVLVDDAMFSIFVQKPDDGAQLRVVLTKLGKQAVDRLS